MHLCYWVAVATTADCYVLVQELQLRFVHGFQLRPYEL
jgi:hypothetical protein